MTVKQGFVMGKIKSAFLYFMSLVVVVSVLAGIPLPANAAPDTHTLVKSGNSLILDWEDQAGATDYKVTPTVDGVTGTPITTSAASVYTEGTSLPNTTYTYSVYAVQPIPETDPVETEDVLLFTTTPYKYNLSSLSASVTRASYNSITLSYTNVRAVSQYEIYRSTRSASGFTLVTTTASTSYVNTGLNFNTTYYYKVRGVQTTSTGTYYTNWSPTVSKITALTKPTLSVNKMNYNSVGITWTEPEGATYYKIYRSLYSSSGFTYIATTSSNSYINSGLNTGTRYYYKVEPYRSSVKGLNSNIVSSKPTLGSATITRIDVKLNEAKVTWGKVNGATGYKVYRATSSGGYYSHVGTVTSASFLNKGLANNKAYFYKVLPYRMVNNKAIYGGTSPVFRTVTPKPAGMYYYAKDAFLVLETDGYGYFEVCYYTVCDWSYDENGFFYNRAYVVVPADWFLTFSSSSSQARIIDGSVYYASIWSSFTKPGMYFVGYDLRPGYYLINGNESYYYSVCASVYCDWSNGYDDNDYVSGGGQRYVYLAEGDFLTISGPATGSKQ